MNRTRSLALVIMPILVGSLALAMEPSSRSTDPIVLQRCTVEYRYATNLGASVNGILQDRLVELGDAVKAGQLLGRLQDIEQQALEKVAKARYNLAATRVRTAEPLIASRAISKDEFDILKGSMETELNSVEAAWAAVKIRQLISPHDGVVVGIFKNQGESVNYTSDPVFRVVNTDLLRVTGYLDVTDAWRVQPGQSVRVSPEAPTVNLPIKGEVFDGRVVFVDSEIDPKTQTCRVIAEVINRNNLLRSGLEARMEIKANDNNVRK